MTLDLIFFFKVNRVGGDNIVRTGLLLSTLQYLNAYLISVHSSLFPLNVALDVVVAHGDPELDPVLHVDHAAVWVVLGVNLAVENLVGPHRGDHLGSSAIDGDVVART